MVYKWPDNFPGNVPPSDAKETTGIVFRFSSNLPPINADFKQYREEDINLGKIFTGENLITSYGASVFSQIEQAKKTKNRFKNRLSDKIIVTGTLIPELGLMLKTYGPHHHTIWFQKDSTPHEYVNMKVE